MSHPTASAAADGQTTLVYPPWQHNYGFNRFRQFHLIAYGGYGHQIADPRGIAAVKLLAADAAGPKDDDELTVLGVNAGRREIIYNRSLFSLGFLESDSSVVLVDPVGIAVDAAGLVAVTDRGAGCVLLLRIDKRMRLCYKGVIDLSARSALRALRAPGAELDRPCGVAIEAGSIYIADSGNDRIVVADTTGQHVRDVAPGRSFMEDPFGVSVIADREWNHYQSAFVVVTCDANQRLVKLSLAGVVQECVDYSAVSDRGGGFYFPAIDYYGNVFVTDAVSGCVYKFDRHLRPLARLECAGEHPDDLDAPRGIAIYRRFGQVFVAEETGVSYFWVGTDVLNTECRAVPGNGGGKVIVRFFLTEQSNVTLLLGPQEEEPEVIVSELFTEPGLVRRTVPVPASALPRDFAKCNYFLTVRAEPTYASKGRVVVERRVPVRWSNSNQAGQEAGQAADGQ